MVKRKATSSSFRWLRKAKRTKTKNYRRKKMAMKRRRRNVKQRRTKAIKGVVKRILQCQENIGLYTKEYMHQFSPIVDTANYQVVFDAGQINDANSNNNGINDPTNGALKFSPFTAQKLLDAVSVLYNGKTKGLNYNATTGSTPPPNEKNFATKDLKVEFTYCSFELLMKNNSECVYDIEVYFGKPKMDLADSLQGRWNANIGNVAWLQGSPTINTINQTPGMIPSLKQEYDIQKTVFRFHPGDSRRFFTKFRGCVDFSKHLRGNEAELQNYMKGISQSWMFVVKPMESSNQYTVTPGTDQAVLVSRQTNAPRKLDCLIFETREVYKLMEPDGTDDQYQGNHRVFYVNYPQKNGDSIRQIVRTSPVAQPFSGHP